MTQATPPPPQLQIQKPFSLAPAIFIPFAGISKDPLPARPEGNLQRIVENVERQHAAVRRNMVFLLEKRGKALVETAKEELAWLEQRWDGEGERDGKVAEILRRSVEEMMRRVSVPSRDGAKGEDYEVKVGGSEFKFKEGNPMLAVGTGEDVEMGGIELQPRTPSKIREELAMALRDLVERGVAELEAYDIHAENTIRLYKPMLEGRRTFGSL